MGADLYRHGFEENRKKYEPLFEKWIKRRDTFHQNTKLATLNDATKDYYIKQEKWCQSQVTRWWNKMYPEKYYFRDSYNDSSIMWQLGLSWWKDVIPKLKDGLLSGDSLFEVKELVKNAPVPDYTNRSDRSYYTKKRERLIKLLSDAYLNDESITCSL
jgi:hypothetical protein